MLEEIAPGVDTFAVALGGADGKTLFICVAPGFDPAARATTSEGKIIATRVDIPAA